VLGTAQRGRHRRAVDRLARIDRAFEHKLLVVARHRLPDNLDRQIRQRLLDHATFLDPLGRHPGSCNGIKRIFCAFGLRSVTDAAAARNRQSNQFEVRIGSNAGLMQRSYPFHDPAKEAAITSFR
jgi:hypothetical protein